METLLELGSANPSAHSSGSSDLWWNWEEMERHERPFLGLWFVSQTCLGPGGAGQLLSALCQPLGCSRRHQGVRRLLEADIWCCTDCQECIYCCPEHLPRSAGLELCRAEDALPAQQQENVCSQSQSAHTGWEHIRDRERHSQVLPANLILASLEMNSL